MISSLLGLAIAGGIGATVGGFVTYRCVNTAWRTLAANGLREMYELGITCGRERERQEEATAKYARIMGMIHHPLGSPLHYGSVDSLMPRITEKDHD